MSAQSFQGWLDKLRQEPGITTLRGGREEEERDTDRGGEREIAVEREGEKERGG